jgi:ribosomal protein L16 Arg81 hydroxylase
MAMDVRDLFADTSLAAFVGEYWHRLPFARSGGARDVCQQLGGWETFGVVLGDESADVLVVRAGEQCAGARPRSLEEAAALSRERHTMVVRHAERQHAGLGQLARTFEQIFGGPVDIQMFATPAGEAGFSWHYDAEDVFILQTTGEKEYSLRKNTVNPWPLEETLPADMRYEREIMPMMRVTLKAGDLLYIPCGYWHKADASASAEPALSLAVGVMSRSAMEVFDWLRPRLFESMLWRQRLPIVGEASPLGAEELESAYRELCVQLGLDLAKRLSDPRTALEFLRAMSAGDALEE